MATNPWFDSQFSEEAGNLDSELYADLIEEMIQTKGRDFIYLPRTVENFDSFFLEDRHPSSFNDAITIELYMENVQEWGGQGDMYSKFGLEIRDQATLIVSKRRFTAEVSSILPEIVRPREGDLLLFPNRYDSRVRAFEISYVDKESTFYQLGDLPTYRLTVRNFEYSGETFDTGVEQVDDYSQVYSLSTVLNLGAGTGTYVIGETVTNGSWSADLIAYESGAITLFNVVGELNPLLPIVGQTSGASYLLESVQTEVGNDTTQNDNDYVADQDVTDFSESNPFSGY